MAGVDLRTVQELLGHKTIAVTVRYSHLAPKHTLAAVERLDVTAETPTDTTTDNGGPILDKQPKRSSCSKTFDSIGLQWLSPGGGMAYAGDLKSPDAYASCGFDPHPGHQFARDTAAWPKSRCCSEDQRAGAFRLIDWGNYLPVTSSKSLRYQPELERITIQ